MKRIGTILRATSNGYRMNMVAFHTFTIETATLYVRHYTWYGIPATVHRILGYGSHKMKSAVLSTGKFSEEQHI
jgi:hypothetical protein